MIKKFEDYINELWSKGVERNMSGKKRLENSFWIDESMFEVEGYKDYYISPDPEGFFIDVYHKPDEVKLLSFEDLDLSDECFLVSPHSTVEDRSKKITYADFFLITSVEFKRAINKTIKSQVPDDYFAIY